MLILLMALLLVSILQLSLQYQQMHYFYVAGLDYVPVINHTITFGRGDDERFVNISLRNDVALEADEEFGITLTPKPGYSDRINIGVLPTATVTIEDDDCT